jgi:hypothetical protein
LNLLIVFQKGAALASSAFQSRFNLKRCHRSFCAAAILAFPAAGLGPVERPPWYLHFVLLGMTFFLQGSPERVLAPQ